MMRYVRRITNTAAFDSHMLKGDRANPSKLILDMFFDAQGELSIFKLDDKTTVADIAAALLLSAGQQASPITFAVSETEVLKAAGLKAIESAGDTSIPSVDAAHCHLLQKTTADVTSAIDVFTREIIIVPARDVAAQMTEMALKPEVPYVKVSGSKEKNPERKVWFAFSHLAAKNLLKLAPV